MKNKADSPYFNFGNVIKNSGNSIKLNVCKDVKNTLKNNRIVEIVEAVKSGKTITAFNIAELKGRPIIVVSQHHEKFAKEKPEIYQEPSKDDIIMNQKAELDKLKKQMINQYRGYE